MKMYFCSSEVNLADEIVFSDNQDVFLQNFSPNWPANFIRVHAKTAGTVDFSPSKIRKTNKAKIQFTTLPTAFDTKGQNPV